MVESGASRPINVLIATPLGEGGKGGIDRVMDSVRSELATRPRLGLTVDFAPTRGPGSILLSAFFLTAFLVRMAARRPDVVHINLSSDGSTRRKLVVAAFARRFGIPYIVHLHSGRYPRFWASASPSLDRAILGLFSSAAAIVVLGRVWREFVLARLPGASARICILPNATPAPASPRSHGESSDVRILFLGRLGTNKGTPQLIEALASLAGMPGWRAVVAGDGDVAETRLQVTRAGLEGRIDVPGWVGPEQVAELIATSDVLTLPSFEENLPMSVIEGMAAGLAVVATPVGAVEDIVTHGETGLFVQPGDVDGLAGALRRLVEEPALRDRLGAAGQAVHRERLDIVPYVDRLVSIWREVAGR